MKIQPYLCVVTAVLLLTGCVTTPTIEAYVVDIKPLPSTLLEQRAQLDLLLQNVTSERIDAQGIEVRLVVNDRQFARGVKPQQLAIEPLSDITTSVVVHSRAIDTIRQVLALPDRVNYSYRLKGRLFTQGLDLRFNHGGEISKEGLGGLLQGPAQ